MGRKNKTLGIKKLYQTAYVEVDDLFELAAHRGEDPFLLILDGLEDPRNFGAILRTAEAVGVHGVIIPKRRSVGVGETVEKTSTGASRLIPIAQVSNITEVMKKMKKREVWITGLDMEATKEYTEINYQGGVALVLGSEGKGISRIVKEHCDNLVKLPMRGKIESLNVSVASGVAMYEILKSRLKSAK